MLLGPVKNQPAFDDPSYENTFCDTQGSKLATYEKRPTNARLPTSDSGRTTCGGLTEAIKKDRRLDRHVAG